MTMQQLRLALTLLLFGLVGFVVFESHTSGWRTTTVDQVSHALELAARQQINVTKSYDPSYQKITYPMGDVPEHTGVCTDVVVRAYRVLDKDLQVLVHEDIKRAWSAYPDLWGLKTTDRNIDHRRVPNLEAFFKRHGKVLPISSNPADYKSGDLVTWRLKPPHGLPHIGIVSSKRLADGTPLIIHNIGRGTEQSDILFQYHISGHFSYK